MAAERQRKKTLITYSRKQPQPLPLDGAQFLKVDLSNYEKHSVQRPSHENECPNGSPCGVDQESNILSIGELDHESRLSYDPTSNDSCASSIGRQTPQHRRLLPPQELTLVPASEADSYISASPLSGSDYGDGDPIRDDQVGIAARFRSPRTHVGPLIPVSVTRKALKMPLFHRTPLARSRSQPLSSAAKRSEIVRCLDGFTASELFVPLRSRHRKARVPRSAKAPRTLQVSTGPSPDVDFSNMRIIDHKLGGDLCAAAADDQEKVAAIAQPTTNVPLSLATKPRRRVTFSDRVVCAQLSSVCAPSRSEASSSVSSDPEDEFYQDDLLRSDHGSNELGQPGLVEKQIEAIAVQPCETASLSSPSLVPRHLLNPATWIGVDEDIQDDELLIPTPPSFQQPVRQETSSVRRTRTVINEIDGKYFDTAQQALQVSRSGRGIARRDSSMLLDDERLSSTVEDQHLYSGRPELMR